MAEWPLHILQVSTVDIAGGAENVAWNLFQTYRMREHASWLAVGHKRSDDPDVFLIRDRELCGRWSRFWRRAESSLQLLDGRARGAWRLRRLASKMAELGGSFDRYRGLENFRFPETWHLLRLTPRPPDIVHYHNLHGNYFDLRALPWLSGQVRTILTLHDSWLLSGHCAYSFECDRWKIGCGHCPDLSLYPAIQRDATAYNWRRKQRLYTRSRLHVATPSRWLMQKVTQSMLASAVEECRVIPYGIDLSIFHPADRRVAREELGITSDATVFLFAANGVRGNMWKDYQTMRAAVAHVAERLHKHDVVFIALGEDSPAERIGRAKIQFVPYQRDPKTVACYYQAANIYVHATRADTFPNAVLEALACGTPVVATAVGGVTEQIKGLRGGDCRILGSDEYGVDEATGVLVAPGDARGMALGIERLLQDEPLRRCIGENAARDAKQRFDLQRHADDYLRWYGELLRDAAPRCRVG